jgi:hypothetical protein
MNKPPTIEGYSSQCTRDCERVLVTLLRGLGPWKHSLYLVGGLTPRYLVPARPPAVPPHAGTLDVDVVIELQMLADTEAYQTLEQNFERMGFERGVNRAGQKVSWRWQTKTEHGAQMILELLADAPDGSGGKVRAIPSQRRISALNVPHCSIVFDLHDRIEIEAELLGKNGVVRETVRYANLVSFTCLKAFAFDDRGERKDAHDLIYCLEHSPIRASGVADAFRKELAGSHAAVIGKALEILKKRFAHEEEGLEGYRKDGPVAVAKFELGEGEESDLREGRALRQRQASSVIDQLLGTVFGGD